jgi:hypothetical protein
MRLQSEVIRDTFRWESYFYATGGVTLPKTMRAKTARTKTTQQNLGPAKSTTNLPQTGIIQRGHSYSLKLFIKISGLGHHGMRAARDNGLRVVYVGRTAYVLGDDWLDFLQDPKRKTERW